MSDIRFYSNELLSKTSKSTIGSSDTESGDKTDILQGYLHVDTFLNIYNEYGNNIYGLTGNGALIESSIYIGPSGVDNGISFTEGQFFMCLEPNAQYAGNELPSTSMSTVYKEIQHTSAGENIDRLSSIAAYYYLIDSDAKGDLDFIAAAQAEIWDELYDVDFANTNGINKELALVRGAFNNWESSVSGTSKSMSSAPTHYLEWNASENRYQTTISSDSKITSYGFLNPAATYFNKSSGSNYSIGLDKGNLIAYTTNKDATKATYTASFDPFAKMDMKPIYIGSNGQDMVSGNSASYKRYFSLEMAKGNLKIIKKAESNQNGSSASTSNGSGYDFKIYFDKDVDGKIDSGEYVKTVTTNSSGVATYNNIPTGQYIIEEINVPSYMTKPANQVVTVSRGNTKDVTFTNKYKTGSITVSKKGESFNYSDSSDVFVSGVNFIVKNKDTGKYVTFSGSGGTYSASSEVSGIDNATILSTNSSGKIVLNNLRYSNYEIIERSAPSGYIISGSKSINLNTSSESISFSNDIIKGNFELYHAVESFDQFDNTYKAYGSHSFKIYDVDPGDYNQNSNSTYVGTMSHQGSGRYTFNNLDYGKYKVCSAGYNTGYKAPNGTKLESGNMCYYFNIRSNSTVRLNSSYSTSSKVDFTTMGGIDYVVFDAVRSDVNLYHAVQSFKYENDAYLTYNSHNFNLYDTNTGFYNDIGSTKYLTKLSSISNGKYEYKDLKYGNYRISQSSMDAGYKNPANTTLSSGFLYYDFKVTKDGELIIIDSSYSKSSKRDFTSLNSKDHVKNDVIKGSVELYHAVESFDLYDDSYRAYDNHTFKVYDIDPGHFNEGTGSVYVDDLNSNGNGKYSLGNLDYGKYKVCSSGYNSGYKAPDGTKLESGNMCYYFNIRNNSVVTIDDSFSSSSSAIDFVTMDDIDYIIFDAVLSDVNFYHAVESLNNHSNEYLPYNLHDFKLYDTDTGFYNNDGGNSYLKKFDSIEEGIYSLTDLKYGNYRISQSSMNDGYRNPYGSNTLDGDLYYDFEVTIEGELIVIDSSYSKSKEVDFTNIDGVDYIINDAIIADVNLYHAVQSLDYHSDEYLPFDLHEFSIYDLDPDNYNLEPGYELVDVLNPMGDGEYYFEDIKYGHYIIKQTKQNVQYRNPYNTVDLDDVLYYEVFVNEDDILFTINRSYSSFDELDFVTIKDIDYIINDPVQGDITLMHATESFDYYSDEYSPYNNHVFSIYDIDSGNYNETDKSTYIMDMSSQDLGKYRQSSLKYGNYEICQTTQGDGYRNPYDTTIGELCYQVFINTEAEMTYVDSSYSNYEGLDFVELDGIDYVINDVDLGDIQFYHATESFDTLDENYYPFYKHEFTLYDVDPGFYNNIDRTDELLNFEKTSDGFYYLKDIPYGNYKICQTTMKPGYLNPENTNLDEDRLCYNFFMSEEDEVTAIDRNYSTSEELDFLELDGIDYIINDAIRSDINLYHAVLSLDNHDDNYYSYDFHEFNLYDTNPGTYNHNKNIESQYELEHSDDGLYYSNSIKYGNYKICQSFMYDPYNNPDNTSDDYPLCYDFVVDTDGEVIVIDRSYSKYEELDFVSLDDKDYVINDVIIGDFDLYNATETFENLDSGYYPYDNHVFTIYDANSGRYNEQFVWNEVSDMNFLEYGHHYIDSLKYGNYVVIQSTLDEGYKFSDGSYLSDIPVSDTDTLAYSFTINEDGSLTTLDQEYSKSEIAKNGTPEDFVTINDIDYVRNDAIRGNLEFYHAVESFVNGEEDYNKYNDHTFKLYDLDPGIYNGNAKDTDEYLWEMSSYVMGYMVHIIFYMEITKFV